MIKKIRQIKSEVSGCDVVVCECDCGNVWPEYITFSNQVVKIECSKCGETMSEDESSIEYKRNRVGRPRKIEDTKRKLGEYNILLSDADRKLYITYWRLKKKGELDEDAFVSEDEFIAWSMLNGYKKYKTLKLNVGHEGEKYSKNNCGWRFAKNKNWSNSSREVKLATYVEEARRYMEEAEALISDNEKIVDEEVREAVRLLGFISDSLEPLLDSKCTSSNIEELEE